MLRINRPDVLPKLMDALGYPQWEYPFMYVIDSFNREAYYLTDQTEESSWRQKDAQHGIEFADLADCLLAVTATIKPSSS